MSKIVQQLNQLQADCHSLFVKFHDYHWNVKGLHFFSVHSYTEEAYEQMSKLFDDTAERALQIGGKAITCPKQLLELAKAPKIKQESYCAREVARAMIDAYAYLKEAFLTLRQYANEVDDFVTVSFAEEQIAHLEKTLWMLNYTADDSAKKH